MSGELLTLQWGPRTAEFRLSYTDHWVYRFADMYMQLDRRTEDGSDVWTAHCSPYAFGDATPQAALDALRERVTARRDEVSHFLNGVYAHYEIWEFDILSQDQTPYLVGVASAGSFTEACDKYKQAHPEWSMSMRTPRLTKEQADERRRSIQ